MPTSTDAVRADYPASGSAPAADVFARVSAAGSRPAHCLWISWERHRRTRELACALDADLFEFTSSAPGLTRYVVLLLRTARCLFHNRPDVLFVQCPSILLALVAAVLKPALGYCLVVDLHNAAVRPSRKCLGLVNLALRIVHSSADLNLVTNDALSAAVERAGRTTLVLPDRVPEIAASVRREEAPSATVVFVCSYAPDEPVREMIEAAHLLDPSVVLYVTGDDRRLASETRRRVHMGTRLTGFLSQKAYDELLRRSDVIVDLTTREDCLVCGAYEAVALGKPLVTSDTRALRGYFTKGTVYARHEPQSLARAIGRAVAERDVLAAEMNELKQDLAAAWARQFAGLRHYLSEWCSRSGVVFS